MPTETPLARASQPGLPRPPVGTFYQVTGRSLFAHPGGAGRPAVVILPGAGTVGLDYLNVAREVASFTTSVVYDRAGTGWSERVSLPRSSSEVTDELRALLLVMGVTPPYVLVGHSLGGLYARHYATRFPGEVSGLVLLDPAHEDYDAYMPPELHQTLASRDLSDLIPDELPPEFIEFYRHLFAAEVPDWPDDIKNPLIEAHVHPAWIRTGAIEGTNLNDLYTEVVASGPLPDIPVVIVVSTGIDDFRRAVSLGQSEQQLGAEVEGRRHLYAAVVADISRGRTIAVPDVGHVTLHLRRPDVVVEAVRDVIARSGGR